MENQLGWTTIEQSEKLIEAGLDSDTADMFYIFDPFVQDIAGLGIGNSEETGDIPCWSFGALIGLMSNTISIGTKTYCLWINTTSCGYYRMKENLPTSGDCLFSSFKYNNLNPICECIVFLLENNYINKGETK